MTQKLFVAAGTAAAFAILTTPRPASAQGCVLIRQAAPVIGSISSTYIRPGEWQLDVSFRDSTAARHYSLDVEQVQRQQLGTTVINTQKQTLFSVAHAVNDRVSFAVAVPVVVATWGIPRPLTPPGPRATEHGQGLGEHGGQGHRLPEHGFVLALVGQGGVELLEGVAEDRGRLAQPLAELGPAGGGGVDARRAHALACCARAVLMKATVSPNST